MGNPSDLGSPRATTTTTVLLLLLLALSPLQVRVIGVCWVMSWDGTSLD